MGNQKSLLQQNKSLKDVIKNIGKEDVIDPCAARSRPGGVIDRRARGRSRYRRFSPR